MHKPEIRMSQMVHSFGPGSLVDLPDDSIIMGGLEEWRYGEHEHQCRITEVRLLEKVKESLDRADIRHAPGLYLRTPPPKSERDNGPQSRVTGWIFPQWFVVNHVTYRGERRSRPLVHRSMLDNQKTYRIDGKKHSAVPIRVVAACRRGHITDVEWKVYVHRGPGCAAGELFIEEEGSSGDISRIHIRCSCGRERGLGDAAVPNADSPPLGHCRGQRPWLGLHADEECTQPLRLLTRSASNAYFPLIQSVISIPVAEDPIVALVRKHWKTLQVAPSIEVLKNFLTIPDLAIDFEGIAPAVVMATIEAVKSGAPAPQLSVKGAEFQAFTGAQVERSADKPDGEFFARKLPKDAWNRPALSCVQDIVLVHRLREVVAQYGFTRLDPIPPKSDGESSVGGLKPASLARSLEWLPTVENRGEGIFIQFKADVIKAWLEKQAVKDREEVLSQGFKVWKDERPTLDRQFEGAAYYMLHSLAHMLITSLALDCGYPMSSLRERIYGGVGMEGSYGILIYTGSSDAEGTLGGLIEAGRKIDRHFLRALQGGKLCSNDPVCSNHDPRSEGAQNLLGSACHGCQLIAETSCEQFNNMLDRSLVVPTLSNRDAAFFA